MIKLDPNELRDLLMYARIFAAGHVGPAANPDHWEAAETFVSLVQAELARATTNDAGSVTTEPVTAEPAVSKPVTDGDTSAAMINDMYNMLLTHPRPYEGPRYVVERSGSRGSYRYYVLDQGTRLPATYKTMSGEDSREEFWDRRRANAVRDQLNKADQESDHSEETAS